MLQVKQTFEYASYSPLETNIFDVQTYGLINCGIHLSEVLDQNLRYY